jgi:hypothetical protein
MKSFPAQDSARSVLRHITESILPAVQQERSSKGLPSTCSVWLALENAVDSQDHVDLVDHFLNGHPLVHLIEKGLNATTDADTFIKWLTAEKRKGRTDVSYHDYSRGDATLIVVSHVH